MFDRHICGGAILDKYTVLTAAHCTDGLEHSRFSVRVGATRHKDGESVRVATVIQNSEYNSTTIDKDISILKLANPLTFANKVQPIALQPDGLDVPPGTVARVAGWGADEEESHAEPQILSMVDVEVINSSQCQKSYAGAMKITPRMLCAHTPGKDSCQFDSGGPLVANRKVIGVVSWGFGCGLPQYPGVYAKVSDMYQWIVNNI